MDANFHLPKSKLILRHNSLLVSIPPHFKQLAPRHSDEMQSRSNETRTHFINKCFRESAAVFPSRSRTGRKTLAKSKKKREGNVCAVNVNYLHIYTLRKL
uniref:(northern house mosquito) hypothetical protein n=1 Tax=Culex pipiens TaxID=7175 RepID=A0A8D8C2Q9_CULPI